VNTWKPPTKKKDEGKPQADTKPQDDSEGTEGTGRP
jgi:hypothetical protein